MVLLWRPFVVLISILAAVLGTNSLAVTVSGGSFTANNSGAIATMYLKIDNDGKMYKKVNNGNYSQISSSTDWIRPASSAPGAFEVRFTNKSGDTLTVTGATAENTWFTMSTSDFILFVSDNSVNVGGDSATFTIEIRDGSSGSALDTGNYTLTADREDS